MSPISTKAFMGKTIDLLSRALDFRSANHSVISGNIANIETPGYRSRELSFNDALQDAVTRGDVALRSTDPDHFSHPTADLDGETPPYTLTISEASSGSSQLDLDKEMAKMAENNLLYEGLATLLSKKFNALRSAIDS